MVLLASIVHYAVVSLKLQFNFEPQLQLGMRYEHETCTKITPKEYAIMVTSKNDQVCKVSHIVLTYNITSKHNSIENGFIQMVEPSHMELHLVYRQYRVK